MYDSKLPITLEEQMGKTFLRKSSKKYSHQTYSGLFCARCFFVQETDTLGSPEKSGFTHLRLHSGIACNL